MSTALRLYLFMAFYFLVSISLYAQVQTPRTITINSNCNGFYEYLPEGYSTTGKTFPLMIFIHGIGELGNGSSDLSTVLRNGPPKLINNGTFPKSFTVNGATYSFIVISPQFIAWPTALDVQAVIDYAVKTYKVDQTRIYVTGLSMGGGATWDYAAYSQKFGRRVAAILPISGASSPTTKKIDTIAASNLPVWALHNLNDPTVSSNYTINYVNGINAYVPKPSPAARMTIFNASGHDAWTKTYDPSYTENGLNVYQWMLQYQRSSTTTSTNQAPVANAGADKLITLPTNSVTMSGSGTDADGSIASYAWSKISGPTQFTFSSTTIANPVISSLTAGTYVFRLTVKDNSGATGYDDVSVIANQPPTANAGADKLITLPTSSLTMSGSGTDADGSIASYAWSKISGPTQFAFNSATIANPVISSLAAGTYVFRLTVKDNRGATAYDDITVTVNQPPTANAGADKTITLPTSSITMSGSGTDADGSIASYAWSKISGPTLFIFSSTTIVNPVISSLVAGTYVFRLTVKDNRGATAYDDVTVIVNSATSSSSTAVVKVVQVNVYGGSNPYSNSAWNNWNVADANLVKNSGAFKYSTGTSSTISANLSYSQGVADNSTSYGSGMAPAEVLRYTSYSYTTRALTISGLSPTTKYDLSFFASRNKPYNYTIFTIGSTSVKVGTHLNLDTVAAFKAIAPDSRGVITVTLTNTYQYNYLNGFVIKESGSTTTARTVTNNSSTAAGLQQEDASKSIQMKGDELKVYPNPVKDMFTLSVRNNQIGTLRIMINDVNGKFIKEIKSVKDQEAAQLIVQVSDLPAGIYMLTIQVGKWKETRKVLKL